MDNITLGQIQSVIVWMVSFCGGLFAIFKAVKTAVAKGLEPIDKKIDRVDLASTKNFLVARISEMKKGQELDDITRERFMEEFEHYRQLGGNSYIQLEVDKLRKDGKI